MLSRGVLAAMAVVAATRAAHAAPKRKVSIETTPPGATVYLESKENGPVCAETPCEFDAPVGETPMIVELENHVSLIELIEVPARGKVPKIKLQLDAAVGKLVVTGPKGAQITINDEDKGKAPAEIEMPAGAYIVVLSQGGKQIDSLPVEVTAGEEVSVAGAGEDGDDANEEATDDEKPVGEVAKSSGSASRRGFVAVSALVDVVFRDFTYAGIDSVDTLSPASEVGNLIGPAIELWPGVLAGIGPLRGLSIFARYQLNFGAQPVTGPGIAGTTVPTWRSFELSLRQRFALGRQVAIEASAGYVSDRFGYTTDVMADLNLVPDVAYTGFRVGGRGVLRLGSVEPFVAGEARIVTSGGPLEARFFDTRTSGYRASLGATAKIAMFEAKVEAGLVVYDWAFSYVPDGMFRADAGSDSLKQINLALRYAY